MDRDLTQKFIDEAYQRLVRFYEKSSRLSEAEKDKQKHRLEGFLHAGEFLGYIDHKQGLQLLEQAHIQVFNESSKQRQQRLQSTNSALSNKDDKYFEIPAYERRRNQT